MKNNKLGGILLSVGAAFAGLALGAGIFLLGYRGYEMGHIRDEVTIETGSPIVFDDFFTEQVPRSSFYTDVSGIDTNVPGSYKLLISFWRFRKSVILNVVDTTAPVAEAVPQTVYTGNVPDASSTVTNVFDLASYTISYVTEPDTSAGGEYVYQVSVKDASGNETIVDVPFTVIDDHTAPLIYGAHDIEGFVGDPIAYLDGITVTDNYDPDPELVVDNSQVHTNMSSSFPVTYTATDENGNSSSVTVMLHLRVKPERYYDLDVLYDLVRQTVDEYDIYEEDMTDVQKAFRIFNWCYNYIHYVGTSDKVDWTVGAYDGLTTLQGDCFTYYAICRAMLDVAGIPNMLVERYPITWSPHYWNLVYLEGQWWHCDSCYAYYHEGYYFMYAYNDLNHSDHGYDLNAYGPEINIAQDSIQSRVNYSTLEVGGSIMKNVLEYLDASAASFPDKVCYRDEKSALTFLEVKTQAENGGSELLRDGLRKEPVAVYMSKTPVELAAFMAVLKAGCFYVPIDDEMPSKRIELIFDNLKPRAVICSEDTKQNAYRFAKDAKVYSWEEIKTSSRDEDALKNVRDTMIDTDPAYIMYTSGSTGVPKGVAVCHRSLIDYIESFCEVMRFDKDTIFGSQTPFYFDASLKDIYPTLKLGCETVIVPHTLFMFPVKLVEFLNNYKINTLCWVVSALTMISAFGALDEEPPKYLKIVGFGGEVFPVKQYNRWKKALPDVRYINLYGPTETTGVSMYYEVDREFTKDEVIPLGKPFENVDIFLLDENDRLAPEGEICMRGTCVALGYYSDPERTSAAFVQNPLNDRYPELIYRTGDIAKYNDRGELVFVSRKDYQIKHMGHRVELGEIEADVNSIKGVASSCAVYLKKKDRIELYYEGGPSEEEMLSYLKEKLPRYMVPTKTHKMDKLPLSPNGKIDRKGLTLMAEGK